ncbi:phosphopantetheine-binding protein [Desulfuromonas acetoxidans]|uniref:Acyl carrier protein n=1 Tax=Desulfuromonas acetoxidans (strain DSM 684 / 11070) TaxID=281689 RepID=Q1K0P7_DESA6|nr:phosphopantetheine-binding protein [Desulfuromonas acetoxidans]EAT15894.1 phosphopantetheine-binding [Desulfuromonas acetoxidans DSM 684]MBF0644207.1 acyl carrier protein [Desulfuromonas acetoxidans]NVD24494.1 acyl carrier protein [Desulfuromonas acetoxidans]NVE16556.1 acyl carrier protein [Desulfuromonas acetoxidans]
MTEQEIITTVNTALAEEFELDLDEMTPDVSLYEDLGLDSLDTVDMVIVLEGAFKFKIREEADVKEIRTLGDIHAFVAKKLAAES